MIDDTVMDCTLPTRHLSTPKKKSEIISSRVSFVTDGLFKMEQQRCVGAAWLYAISRDGGVTEV